MNSFRGLFGDSQLSQTEQDHLLSLLKTFEPTEGDCSINDDYAFRRLLIMSNMVISVLYIMLSICAYMYKISILLSFISVVSYIVCVIVTQGPFLTSFLPLIVIIYGMAAILGYLLNKNIN